MAEATFALTTAVGAQAARRAPRWRRNASGLRRSAGLQRSAAFAGYTRDGTVHGPSVGTLGQPGGSSRRLS